MDLKEQGDKLIVVSNKYKEIMKQQDIHTHEMLALYQILEEFNNVEFICRALEFAPKAEQGKLQPYLKAILDNWNAAGLKTVDEINKYIKQREEKRSEKKNLTPHFNYQVRQSTRVEPVPTWLNQKEQKPKTLVDEMTEERKRIIKQIKLQTKEPIETYTNDELLRMLVTQEMYFTLRYNIENNLYVKGTPKNII